MHAITFQRSAKAYHMAFLLLLLPDIQSKASLRWLTAAQAAACVAEGHLMASPEVLDHIQLAERRRFGPSDLAAGSGDVTLDEKGGSYIYVLAEDRAVKLPQEALLESARIFKQGELIGRMSEFVGKRCS